jgi:glutamate 5-kinase
MKIVIKVGTQAILADDGSPLETTMQALVQQIVNLHADGHEVILVSSGAVGSGRRVARELLGQEYDSSLAIKQLLASIGQPDLMHLYAQLFKKHKLLTSQLLLTKQDFQTRRHYLNIGRLLQEILTQKNIIAIINENDSVAIEELMFTDNDELSGLIAAQLNADKLIILSNVEGVYDDHPSNPQAKLISVIDPAQGEWPKVSAIKSSQGRGGMISKLGTARKVSDLGITTHIASIKQPHVIERIIRNESVGTMILPSKKKSNIKRWLAFNMHQQTGNITINASLHKIIEDHKQVISVLPVGIDSCTGDFKKGDFVEIHAANGTKIGVGIAKYDADKLREYLGLKNKPEFIHYDYLHIF